MGQCCKGVTWILKERVAFNTLNIIESQSDIKSGAPRD